MRYMFFGADLLEIERLLAPTSAGVSTQSPFSQWRAGAVTSRMLISGLKLVAKGWPWSPPLQSRMSSVSIAVEHDAS